MLYCLLLLVIYYIIIITILFTMTRGDLFEFYASDQLVFLRIPHPLTKNFH